MNDIEFERVADLDEIADGVPVGVQLRSGVPICLVKVKQEVYAFADRCSHAEFPMSDGEMVDDYVIECGLHGAQFDIRTGQVVELPANEDLPCYEVKIENGAVLVRSAP